MAKIKNINILASSILFTLFLLVFFLFTVNKKENKYFSRNIFARSVEFVKEKKPTPPVSAIFYAEISTDIYNRFVYLEENNLKIDQEKFLEFDRKYFEEKLQKILNKEEKFSKSVLPRGTKYNEFWVGEKPFSPNIENYDRFLLKSDFSYKVPPPPKYGSAKYLDELAIVKSNSDHRTVEQNALINFWGGIPGTETPSGIWQNRLWSEIKNQKSLLVFQKYSDKEYAYKQMFLAQSLADSFMECWKIKYLYNTKRPTMAGKFFDKDSDITINLAMNNPPFPGYVSGHSTISWTAATVLCELEKEKCSIWEQDAENAKNSRLWAGIHFDYDNQEGKKLGIEIGKYYLLNKIK